MGTEALKSIHQALAPSAGDRSTLFILGVCSVLMLLVLVQVFRNQWKRRRRLVERWRQFSAEMGRHALTAPQRALLVEMARREVPEEPGSLLHGLEVFERAVHHHLRPLVSGGDAGQTERAVALVRGLRQALGFSQAPGLEYFSTRELQQGQEVALYASAEAGTPVCHARVGPPREDYLELVDLRRSQPVSSRTVYAVFYSKGRRFCFPTDLLQMDAAHAVCRLGHSIGVRPVDPRASFRAESRAPLNVRADWEPTDAWRTALLQNLSAGGAALVCGFYYEAGERLVLDIRPTDCLPPALTPGARELEERQIAATILEARKLSEDRCLYRVEFRDAGPDDRRYLFRVVQALQLRPRLARA